MNLVNLSVQDLAESFCDDSIVEQLKDCTILASCYDGDYEMEAFVLFEKDGTLYDVYGSHCSCFGLEGQWEPQKTVWKALEKRSFYMLEKDFVDSLSKLIKSNL